MALVLVHDDASDGAVRLTDLADDGVPVASASVQRGDLPAAVAAREALDAPRWVWDDTARRYPALLGAGVRVARSHDLRLCHVILRRSAQCTGSTLSRAPDGPWDAPGPEPRSDTAGGRGTQEAAATLFEPAPAAAPDPVTEVGLQLAAVAGAEHSGRLRLLLAAESTGALLAAEMHHDGLPWRADVHEALLTARLGGRPPDGGRPPRLEALAHEVREALDQPRLNPDSQQDLLAALRRAGLDVTSTRRQELRAQDHPVVAPLLEYKALARLLSANGWHWMEQWARDGRFRPDYVPGGVVTGRWASSGGGALQLPKEIRAAVRADRGWRLVVADAAQLEPRVLAAMSGDLAMAAAGRHADLYTGVVDAGIVATREEAKYAMLGAIYGATTGAGAALMPRLTAAFPRAVGLVEAAARAGERGEVVTTWLGRSSPVPGPRWHAAVDAGTGEGVEPEQVRLARARRRDWGRFTRNFVVQGTAAEWALCWMAVLRRRLRSVDARAHLVFFLHDEVIVHTPEELAEDVAQAVRESAAEAGRLLFGAMPVDFPLDVAVVDGYDQAG